MTAAIDIDAREIRRLQKSLRRFAAVDLGDLADVVGTEAESQTRRRIDEEKRSPDGERWEEWSESYAETRGPQHSLLVGEQRLLDSITHNVRSVRGGVAIDVGSNLEYAGVHQKGSRDGRTPARSYLGFSPDNESDIEGIVNDWIANEVRGAKL